MKIGIQMFVTGYTIDPVTLARAAEDGGFDSFWVPEHAILPEHPVTPYPMTGGAIPPVYGQMADPFVLLGVISGATTTIKLGTGVCIVPERHPLILAKSVSSLDNFSGGRFLFGVGVGWMREEIELFGVDFDTRWKYTTETVDFMKTLWRDGVGGYDGDIVKFPSVICDPLPAQRPGPPVLVGGRASDHTFRRIAKWADGWIIFGASPEVVAAGRTAINEQCERIGRDPSGIEISVGATTVTRDVREAYEEAGADRIIVSLYNHPGGTLPPDQWAIPRGDLLSLPVPTPAETLRALEQVHAQAEL